MPEHNLPVYLSRFVGRRRELDELRKLLGSYRLVTVTGPGGAGKTRLAVHLGEAVANAYPHGVWMASFAGLADPVLVLPAVAEMLGVREPVAEQLAPALVEFLRHRQTLLLLDNCEHLVDACAWLADKVLRACPQVRILATSREALGIEGEVRWQMPPLAPADEAVQLFAERAQAVVPGFALTDRNRPVIAEICSRLDGLPLAVELAASKLRLLGVDELAARLDDRFALLTGGTRTAPFRQQTLRAVFDWSHETLSPKEQAVWRRLAVFAGTFGLREAESVCEGDPIAREEVFHLLGQLVDKSIVQAYPGAGAAESRYRLLDTIRHYGLEKLADSGEELAVRSRHCQAFAALAHNPSANPNLAQSAVSLATLDAAEENLCAALDWGLNYDPDSALRLCASLWRWWYDRARPVEPFRFLTAALSLPAAFEQPAKRVFLLNAASRLALQQGSTPAAVAFLEEALVISRELDDSRMIADSLLSLGGVRLEQGELEQALVCLHEALDRYRRVGNRLFESVGLMWLARLAVHRKELHEAKLMAMEGIRMSALSRHIPRFLYTLSEAAFAQGDLGTAHRYANEAYHWNYSEEDPIARIVSALLLARAELADGNPVRALELVREALRLMRGDFRRSLGHGLLVLGAVLTALGHYERAARVHGATAAFHRLTATRTYAHHVEWRDGLVAAVRKALGDERFHQCWDEGERMTFREAIAYGLEELPPVPAEQAAPAVQAAPGWLTERELQVVRLVAAGLTDREIASQLYISRRTVDAHLRHIFNKVNVPTRAALTAWAVRSGLDRAEQSGP